MLTSPAAANFHAMGTLGELMALFSGSVFFLSVLDQTAYPWAASALRVASVGRKAALFGRFGLWSFVLFMVNTITLPSVSMYRMMFGGCILALALDTYWGLVFFGFAKGRNELKKD